MTFFAFWVCTHRIWFLSTATSFIAIYKNSFHRDGVTVWIFSNTMDKTEFNQSCMTSFDHQEWNILQTMTRIIYWSELIAFSRKVLPNTIRHHSKSNCWKRWSWRTSEKGRVFLKLFDDLLRVNLSSFEPSTEKL